MTPQTPSPDNARRSEREEREREIDDAYARGYAKDPPEEWVSELGLTALARFDEAEGGEPL